MQVLRLHSYYKPPAIRYIKNILLLVFIGCVVTAVLMCNKPIIKKDVQSLPGGRSAYDKNKIEQQKKISILKRFVS